ncbi:MAG: type II toxin-antitoxin system RelE/ParE family toxin [Verrucomicrobiales bacterium]|nr:type II toxin-antitoxin system RelE/ParE family toxin [Verrucomicrobiales bacterium]
MTLHFLSEASSELYEAAEFYESREPGLGHRFQIEIMEVCRLMIQNPLLWRERTGGYRRVNCPVFPYYVAYFIRDERVIVAAVAHGHRRPGYWKDRLIGQ